MKKTILAGLAIMLIVFAILSLPGCFFPNTTIGNGHPQTKEFSFTGFNKVEVGGVFEAAVTRSDTYGVSVTIDENLMDFVEVKQTGDTLHVGFKPYASVGFPFHASANITIPELQSVNISGASKGTVSGFNNPDIKISVNGASTITIADLNVKNADLNVSGFSTLKGDLITSSVTIDVSGASTLDIEGSAQNANLEATGASSLRLSKFIIQNASVTLSGASNASVQVNGKLDVDISGASRLGYSDSPTLGSVKVSGASTLSRQ